MPILAENGEELLTESGEVILLESDPDEKVVTPTAGAAIGAPYFHFHHLPPLPPPRIGRRAALTGGISIGCSSATARIIGIMSDPAEEEEGIALLIAMGLI